MLVADSEFQMKSLFDVVQGRLIKRHVSVKNLDIGENLLRTWKKAYLERGTEAFPGHGNPTPADDELRRLRAENARLRAERDLLKKLRRQS